MLETPILSIEPSIVYLARLSSFFNYFYFWINMLQLRSLANAVWTSHQIWVSIGGSPHSLGNPIEWKHAVRARPPKCSTPPHSLGKPIETPRHSLVFGTELLPNLQSKAYLSI